MLYFRKSVTDGDELECHNNTMRAMTAKLPDKHQDLLLAARKGNVACIQRCLMAGESPNCVDESGYTPLMLLASHGLGDGLQLVLDTPSCIVNKRTGAMQVALHFAAEKGHTDCVRRLIEGRAMVNVSNDWGETPLLKAVQSGCLDTVELLLKSGAKTEMTDLQGYNALVYAARLGNVEIADALIRYGAGVNNGTKTLPLHQAVAYGQVKMAEALLSFGARQTIRDLHGWLPIELATHTDQADAIDCLIRHGASQEDIDMAVTAAAKYNAVKSICVLLKRGGDPDAADFQGVPALFTAVDLGYIDVVLQLIRHNCNVSRCLSRVYLLDPSFRDLFSSVQADLVSPLMIAFLRGSASVVKLLACAGASSSVVLRLSKLPILSSSNADVVPWLTDFYSSPLSLAHLARLAIRRALGRRATNTIARLPIPRPLMDYLELRDVTEHLELRESD